MSNAKFSLLILLSLTLFGCINTLKAKEVLEGSEAWIRELTRGMTITAQYPEGEVRLHQPYDFVITIKNDGEHEPHLNVAVVEVLNGPDGLTCTMVDPEPLDIEPFSSGVLFYMPPKEVSRNAITTIRIECTFAEAGIYKLHMAAEFRESGQVFISKVFSVTAR